MLASVPALDVQQAGLQTIYIGQVALGPITVGDLVIDNVDVSTSAAQITLQDVRVTVTIHVSVEWSVHIGMPDWIPDINEGDTYDLGSFSVGPVPIGTIVVPGVNNIHLDIPTLQAQNVSVAANPIGLSLHNASAEQVHATNVALPAAGFTLAGLMLNSVQGNNISVPAAHIDQATVGHPAARGGRSYQRDRPQFAGIEAWPAAERLIDMLTTISEADIQKSGVNTVNVGQVNIGPIQIGQLLITDFELNTAGDGAFLRNFRVTITYTMRLDWHLHIEVPGHVMDDSGSEDLDSPTFIVGFGDVRVPGLENLKIDLASLSVSNVAAVANAVSNLQLGAAVAEQIQARNLKLPAQGFTLAGLGIGGLNIGGFGVPAASLDSVTIGRVHGDAFPLGQMSLSNLALPSVSTPDITGQGVDVTATPKPKAFHLDLGCLDLTLKVNPQAEAQIDQLVIRNVTASTSIGKIELQNVVAPYELLNLTLSQVGIDTISVPTVAIA